MKSHAMKKRRPKPKPKPKRKPTVDWKSINCWGPSPTVRETLQ